METMTLTGSVYDYIFQEGRSWSWGPSWLPWHFAHIKCAELLASIAQQGWFWAHRREEECIQFLCPPWGPVVVPSSCGSYSCADLPQSSSLPYSASVLCAWKCLPPQGLTAPWDSSAPLWLPVPVEAQISQKCLFEHGWGVGRSPVSSLTDGGSPAMSINKHVTVISLQASRKESIRCHTGPDIAEAHDRMISGSSASRLFPYGQAVNSLQRNVWFHSFT